MSRKRVLRWSALPYAVLSIGILVLAAALYLIVVELERDTRRIQSEYRDNLTWYAVQFERELSALIETLDSYYLGEPGLTKDDLIDRFDVFWSRVEGAKAGAFGKTYMGFEGVAPLIAKTKQILRDVEPAVMSLQPGEPSGHRSIKRRLQELPAAFHRVSLVALHQQSNDMAEMHQRMKEANSSVLMIFAGVLVGSAILVGLILLEMRHVNELHSSLERRVKERTRDLRQEIAQRKQAERKLRDSHDRIRLIADNLPVLINYFDTDLRFHFINKTFAHWYARPAEEILGHAIKDVLDSDVYDRIKPMLDAALAGEVQCFEQVVEYPDREVRVVEATYVPHVDETGNVQGCFALVHDITERKQIEEEIHKLNTELERRVEERTTELRSAQESLLRKERLATLGQLTGTVAHELRNPLGSIATSIGVIRHKCADTNLDLKGALGRADRSINRCDNIITELLDFAHVKGLQTATVALDPWLSSVLDEQHVPHGITINWSAQTDGAAVSFDPDVLRRAVINVVDNACQAMTHDGSDGDGMVAGELTVATRVNGKRIEIEIADTGPGIPADILPQVMEPLFSTKSFGTGLGLPTVQRIMEDHGGGLEIDSAAGRGTQVVLWLPPCDGNEEGPRI